jgi:very-short-patch-repair endonuclease
VQQVADTLRSREGWKYVKLGAKLLSQGIRHQFEFPLDDVGIFDLVLFDLKALVEFDGPYHRSRAQKEDDEEKDRAGEKEGWKIIRIETPVGVIPPDIIDNLCSTLSRSV